MAGPFTRPYNMYVGHAIFRHLLCTVHRCNRRVRAVNMIQIVSYKNCEKKKKNTQVESCIDDPTFLRI